jgi:hypothetical protein
LEAKGIGFFVPTAEQRKEIAIESASRGFATYGKAFDIVKVLKPGTSLSDLNLKADFDQLVICEIKSTDRDLDTDWHGYFFSLSTAELLIAQSLQDRFRFVLVNIRTGDHLELTLTEVFGRAQAIYPSWSIRF